MIGIDAVDVERLREVMIRDPRTEDRLFTAAERSYCRTKADPIVHFAGTLAVKEAVIKAARLGPLLAWGRRIQVHRDDSGVPRVSIEGRAEHRFDISISHDGPLAVAVAMNHRSGEPSGDTQVSLSARPGPTRPRARSIGGSGLQPNAQLQRYIGLAPAAVSRHHLEPASACFLGSDFP